MIVLDTHVLIWADCYEHKLGRKARALIERMWAVGKVAVPAIAFWEVGLLQLRRRLKLPPCASGGLLYLKRGLPLDGAVAVRALDLSGLHNDPADRFIVATALVHDAALVTADDRVLTWPHALERHDARE